MDKTGTLTKGEFKVSEIVASGISEERLLEIAAYGESFSTHPIAASIKEAYEIRLIQTGLKTLKRFPDMVWSFYLTVKKHLSAMVNF